MNAPISDVEDKRCSAHSSNTWKSQFCVYKFDDQWLDYIAQTKTKWLFRLHNMFDMPNSYWYNILQNCWFINLSICLREGFTKKIYEKVWWFAKPSSTPPPGLVFLRIKKMTPNFLFWEWTIDARNKFYTWSHQQIFLFASVILVYICPK